MTKPILVKIIGAPVACKDGIKDTARGGRVHSHTPSASSWRSTATLLSSIFPVKNDGVNYYLYQYN